MGRLQKAHPLAIPPGQPVLEATCGLGAAVVLSTFCALGAVNKLQELSQVPRRARGPSLWRWKQVQRSKLNCSSSHREKWMDPGVNWSL